jgi:hypothetical protein
VVIALVRWEPRPGISQDQAGSDLVEQFQEFRLEVDSRLSALEQESSRAAGSDGQRAESTQFLLNSNATARTPEELAAMRDTLVARVNQFQGQLGVPTTADDKDKLLAAGFSPDRIDWVERRMEELQMAAQQAEYNWRHGGAPMSSDTMATMLNPVTALRNEMDDAEFERYLNAIGRPTTVQISGVLAGSPAGIAGLQAGDEVVSYNGKRVFTSFELNSMARAMPPNQSVLVEVRRQGQSMQITLPAGPLGIDANVTRELLGTQRAQLLQ